jgi:hypothetical protein
MRKLERKVTFTSHPRGRADVRNWKGTLKGVPCFILGNGPSMNDHPVAELLPKFFTIGINRAFKILDPTILLWQDMNLWTTEKEELDKLKAIKYARSGSDPRGTAYSFKVMKAPYRKPSNPMILFGAGSSGPLAFQLAYSLGCRPIILLGCDCAYRGEQTDFYGKNTDHSGHTLEQCSRGLRWIKSQDQDVPIINCSDNNIFDKKTPLAEIVDLIESKKLCQNTGREYFVSQLFSRKGHVS